MTNLKKYKKEHFGVQVTGVGKNIYFTAQMMADLEYIKAAVNGDRSDSKIVALALSFHADRLKDAAATKTEA